MSKLPGFLFTHDTSGEPVKAFLSIAPIIVKNFHKECSFKHDFCFVQKDLTVLFNLYYYEKYQQRSCTADPETSTVIKQISAVIKSLERLSGMMRQQLDYKSKAHFASSDAEEFDSIDDLISRLSSFTQNYEAVELPPIETQPKGNVEVHALVKRIVIVYEKLAETPFKKTISLIDKTSFSSSPSEFVWQIASAVDGGLAVEQVRTGFKHLPPRK